MTAAARGRHGLGQPVVEERAVGEPGQLVVSGQVARSLAGGVELQDHAMALERRTERRHEQPGARLGAHQVAARSVLQRLERDGLVVDIGDHHDRHQRGRHARLDQRGQPGQLVRGDAQQHHVGLVRLGQGQGVGETRSVDEIEGHRRRRVQQIADRTGAGIVVADEQHPHA